MSIKSVITIGFSLLASKVTAINKEDFSITLVGEQSSHTRDTEGNFKHPFLNQPEHV